MMDKALKPWDIVNRYRAEIMGFAALYITIMHLYVSFYEDAQIPFITVILKRGNIGVDIFLLLSGCGLFYSMKKGASIAKFYKKRIVRVVIPYLILSILYWILLDIIININILQFLKDVTLVSFWTQGVTHYWFVALIIPLYLLYPCIYKLQIKNSKFILGLSILSIIITVCLAFFIREYYDKIEIAITRIPAFLMGSYLGEMLFSGYEKKDQVYIFNGYAVLSFIAFLLSVLLSEKKQFLAEILYRYGSAGVSLLLILIIGFILNRTGKGKIDKILCFFGGITLEIYIVSQSIRNGMLLLNIGTDLGFVPKIVIETLVFVVSIVISKLFLRVEKNINKRILGNG